MNRVLVTGANGFVGSNLVEALVARGAEVTCLVRKTSRIDRLAPLGVKLAYYRDVNDQDGLRAAVAGNEVVYHVAGLTRAFCVEQLFKVNQQGIRSVADACAAESKLPVLVIVSSLAAAGPSSPDRPRKETDRPTPISHYGRSKWAGELAAREWADRVPITIVRPAIVLGPADENGLALFRPIWRFGVHLTAGAAGQRYSIIHAADLCELLILAAERGTRIGPATIDETSPAGGVYFAAAEQSPTWAELGRMIGDALGRRRIMVVPIPKRAVWGVAAAVEGLSRISRRPGLLNFDKAREITAGSWTCAAQTAAEELGFSVGAPLAERLRQTAEWYRKAGWM